MSATVRHRRPRPGVHRRPGDRKSTRLNSSHLVISYAVFCLKKKKKLKPVEGVVVGGGWRGTILSLGCADTRLHVSDLELGPRAVRHPACDMSHSADDLSHG